MIGGWSGYKADFHGRKNGMRLGDGIYTEHGFVRGARLQTREVSFTFDKEICAEINRKRRSCPSLEEALSKIPLWDNEEVALPLDVVEESIWGMLDRSRSAFGCGFYNWMELGAIWRDIEQFAAIDEAIGGRMIERFNQTLDIWSRKPTYS